MPEEKAERNKTRDTTVIRIVFIIVMQIFFKSNL